MRIQLAVKEYSRDRIYSICSFGMGRDVEENGCKRSFWKRNRIWWVRKKDREHFEKEFILGKFSLG